jgi:hypothetical protein
MPFKWLKRLMPGWKKNRRAEAFRVIPTKRMDEMRAQVAAAAKKAADEGKTPRQIAEEASRKAVPTGLDPKVEAFLKKRVEEIAAEEAKKKKK